MHRQSVVATFVTTYKRTKIHEKEREKVKWEKERIRKKKQNKYRKENYPNELQNENAFGFSTKNMTKWLKESLLGFQ